MKQCLIIFTFIFRTLLSHAQEGFDVVVDRPQEFFTIKDVVKEFNKDEHEAVERALKVIQEHHGKLDDRKRMPKFRPLKQGDRVFVKMPNPNQAKIKPKAEGPWIIHRVVGRNTYKLISEAGKKIKYLVNGRNLLRAVLRKTNKGKKEEQAWVILDEVLAEPDKEIKVPDKNPKDTKNNPKKQLQQVQIQKKKETPPSSPAKTHIPNKIAERLDQGKEKDKEIEIEIEMEVDQEPPTTPHKRPISLKQVKDTTQETSRWLNRTKTGKQLKPKPQTNAKDTGTPRRSTRITNPSSQIKK